MWIPFTVDLPRKIEVIRIAEATGLSRREVACILLEFWAWVDEQTTDGVLQGLSVRSLSGLLPDIPGTFFGHMAEVGWLKEYDGFLAIPNFDRWMGTTAKERLRDNRRKRRSRQRARVDPPPCPPDVREMSGCDPDVSRTTVQYSRETNNPPTPKGGERKRRTSNDTPDPDFDRFWSSYPRRQAKQDARKAWGQLKPDAALVEAILRALERQKHWQQWKRDEGRFIPYPATWLRRRGWEDEPPPGEPPPPLTPEEKARKAQEDYARWTRIAD